MADLYTVVQRMMADGTIAALAGNPLAQFGPQRQYLGATLLPERNVLDNSYRESSINYQTVIANDGDRYSPAQLKSSGELVGSFLVELGDQDISRQLDGRAYDALIALLDRNAEMQAMDTIVGWTDKTVNQALIEKTELQRWQAIVNAAVTRVGDNGYAETVTYPNPAGHRAAAGGAWSNNAYDPYADLRAMADLLAEKGYTAGRIITSTQVASMLLRNANIAGRTGGVTVVGATTYSTRTTRDDLNNYLQSDGLPAIETFDLTYRDQVGKARFLPANVMVFVADTGIDAVAVQPEEGARFIPADQGPLGYTAIGRGVGQSTAGRVIRSESKNDKPPRILCEGWQTSLPVITEPEAIAVITGIA